MNLQAMKSAVKHSRKRLWAAVFLSVGLEQVAWAQKTFSLQPVVFYGRDSSTTTEPVDDDTRTRESTSQSYRVHLHALVRLNEQFRLGLTLVNAYGKTETETSFANNTGNNSTSEFENEQLDFGLTLGWSHAGGFSALISYLPAVESEETSGNSTTVYNGDFGLIADFGYRFGSEGFQFGPIVSYTLDNYNKVTVTENGQQGQETDIDQESSFIRLGLGAWFDF